MPAADWLHALYDRSHGLGPSEIAWEERPATWVATLSALGWGEGTPRGSSRLLELLVGQAIHDRDLQGLLEAVHALLGLLPAPPGPELERQIQLLWLAIPRQHRPETWAFFGRVEPPLTPAQHRCRDRFLG